MANTLLSSTRFWSLLSTIAGAGALSSLYYTNTFHNSFKFISTSIISIHLIILFSNPNNIRNTLAPFFHGSVKKWAIRFTAMRAAYLLHLVPEQSVTGLIFVICIWIDAIAIAGIVKPSIDWWMINSVFMAVVSRSGDLYGSSGGYWLIMLLGFVLIYVKVRLEGHKSDETEVKEG